NGRTLRWGFPRKCDRPGCPAIWRGISAFLSVRGSNISKQNRCWREGVASVDLYQPMAAVRELRRCVPELGFRALPIVPWLWALPPDDRRYYPLYADFIELGIPFCLQVGHTGPMRPSEPGRPIPYLDRVALEFPELTIVGGHIGWPWTAEMIALA